MSISTQKPSPEEEADFADIEFCPRPVKQEPAPEARETETKPTTEEKPAETPADQPEQKEETEKQTAETEKASAEPEAEKAPQKEKKKGGFGAILFDALLVLVLLAVLGGGGYYVKQQMDIYRVPTPLELSLMENARLQKQHDELLNDYYQADEQVAMSKSLAHLNSELARLQAECSKLEASINSHRNNVLAMQHEIRTADKECRAIANSLLPGMAIGDAVTTRGKSLSNAYIYRLEGKLIVLRSHEGQIRVPLRELIKKNMPRLARYAFGEEDLIDMSDFDANGDAPAKTDAEKPASAAPRAAVNIEPDYEKSSGSPTVDTSAGSTITAPVAPANSGASWDAPSGDLPF